VRLTEGRLCCLRVDTCQSMTGSGSGVRTGHSRCPTRCTRCAGSSWRSPRAAIPCRLPLPEGDQCAGREAWSLSSAT